MVVFPTTLGLIGFSRPDRAGPYTQAEIQRTNERGAHVLQYGTCPECSGFLVSIETVAGEKVRVPVTAPVVDDGFHTYRCADFGCKANDEGWAYTFDPGARARVASGTPLTPTGELNFRTGRSLLVEAAFSAAETGSCPLCSTGLAIEEVNGTDGQMLSYACGCGWCWRVKASTVRDNLRWQVQEMRAVMRLLSEPSRDIALSMRSHDGFVENHLLRCREHPCSFREDAAAMRAAAKAGLVAR